MSVEVENLSRWYGSQRAVDDLSFSAGKGEILGFLGPNGAGKSTTMKVITGYLPAGTGSVRVGGLDVEKQGLQTRRNIGYLPENNPLYTDMYVREYLAYAGGIYGVKNIMRAVDKMVSATGLQTEQHKKISSLSRGYRQRVGLAQAMIHDPAVLILDEPTSGLDPNQLVEIRNLIKSMGDQKTIIFSTHIMQEVEAVCDRVIIISKGKKVADDRVSTLIRSQNNVDVYQAEFDQAGDFDFIKDLPGVISVQPVSNVAIRITTRPGDDVRQAIFKEAVLRNLVIVGMRREENSLENIFTNLTR